MFCSDLYGGGDYYTLPGILLSVRIFSISTFDLQGEGMEKNKFQIVMSVIIIGIMCGISCAGYADEGNLIPYDQQGIGIAEPFYPLYIPSPDGYQTPVPETEDTMPDDSACVSPLPSLVHDPAISDMPASNVPVFSHDPVGTSYQDPFVAEPFYPAIPPSPVPDTYEEPVEILPVPTQYPDPGVAIPYYPQTPPESEPTPYYLPQPDFSPEYHPSPRYQEPMVFYKRYDDRYYRPSYYDPFDRRWDFSSYPDGILKVSSTPYQAEVYLDNRFRGYTPYSGYLTLENIRPGTYTIRLKYPGYYDYSEDVYVSRGRTTYVDADMVRTGERYQKAGTLSLQSEPSGASVYLDNEYRGFSPVVLNGISAAEHTLLMRKEGFVDYISRVLIPDKQTVSISAVLNPVEVPKTQIPVTSPVESPVPTPTRSGMGSGLPCIAVILCALYMVRSRSVRF